MEQGAVDPSVDEAVQEIEGRIGRPVPCPCCGHTEWGTADDLLIVWGQGVSFDPDALPPGEELPGPGVYQALMFACRNCRFIRQHLIETGPEEPETA